MFLQSDKAGWDNSAQKLKNTNNRVVFDQFGSVKYEIFGTFGGFDPHQGPVLYALGAYSSLRPQLDKGMTYGHCTDRANTFLIHILAGSYDFCRVVTAGILTFLFQK